MLNWSCSQAVDKERDEHEGAGLSGQAALDILTADASHDEAAAKSMSNAEETAGAKAAHPAIDRRRQDRRRTKPANDGGRRKLQRRKREAKRELRRPLETALGQPVDLAEQRLARRIRAHMSRGSLNVTLTDNRYTMISVRRETDKIPQYIVRLHHMFADATPPVTRALALYISNNDADASDALGTFIDSNQDKVKTDQRRTTTPAVTTLGEVHDLQELFDHLNDRYFAGSIDATISWGPRSGKPKRRNSIKMGSYSLEDKFIRIHRSLDRAFVPRFFIEWIVYHEMLHQVHQAPVINGRRRFHTKEFLADEAAYEHYDEARLWERDNLEALLTY